MKLSAGRSAGYAKRRMERLLYSERIDCSPQTITMLQNDLIRSVKKYITIQEERARIEVTGEPPVLRAVIPVLRKKE